MLFVVYCLLFVVGRCCCCCCCCWVVVAVAVAVVVVVLNYSKITALV
jgi:hypothetical protein